MSTLFGQWKTRGGHKAEIDRMVLVDDASLYVGVLWIGDVQVPSWWDMSGDSINADFSLVERRRGCEPW